MVIFHSYVSLPEGIYKNAPYDNKRCRQPTSHRWVVGFAPTGLIPERGVGCHGHQSLGDRPQSLHLATLASFYHVLLILDHIDLCIVSNPFWKWYDLHSLSLSQPHRTISNHHVWSKSTFLGWKSTMCFVKLQFFMLKSTSPHLWFFKPTYFFMVKSCEILIFTRKKKHMPNPRFLTGHVPHLTSSHPKAALRRHKHRWRGR
jgi:hypothetical protein